MNYTGKLVIFFKCLSLSVTQLFIGIFLPLNLPLFDLNLWPFLLELFEFLSNVSVLIWVRWPGLDTVVVVLVPKIGFRTNLLQDFAFDFLFSFRVFFQHVSILFTKPFLLQLFQAIQIIFFDLLVVHSFLTIFFDEPINSWHVLKTQHQIALVSYCRTEICFDWRYLIRKISKHEHVLLELELLFFRFVDRLLDGCFRSLKLGQAIVANFTDWVRRTFGALIAFSLRLDPGGLLLLLYLFTAEVGHSTGDAEHTDAGENFLWVLLYCFKDVVLKFLRWRIESAVHL